MDIVTIIFLAIAASSDSFAVGLSYGIKSIRLNPGYNFLVSFVSGLGTYLSIVLGGVIGNVISREISTYLGSIALIIFGSYTFIQSIRKKEIADDNINFCEKALRNPEIIDSDGSKNIEFGEALKLSIVLCINNIGLGLGAGIVGFGSLIPSVFSCLFSFVFIQFGWFVGKGIFSKVFSETGEIISSLIIIVIGIYEFFL